MTRPLRGSHATSFAEPRETRSAVRAAAVEAPVARSAVSLPHPAHDGSALATAAPAVAGAVATAAGTGRYTLIDALRGLAAVAVMAFHFGTADILRTLPPAIAPALTALFRNGWIGVPIFFTLSGFVISHSIGRHEMTWRRALRFVARRQVRLDPPYWATIALILAIRVAWHWAQPLAPFDFPSAKVLLAHVLYVYDVLRMPAINLVFWSLAIEVHFYCLFVLLLLACRRAPRALPWVMAATAVASFYCAATWRFPHAWFTQHWYLFAIGALTRWSIDGRAPRWMAVGAAGVVLARGLYIGRLEFIFGGAVPLLFFVAGMRGALGRWLGARWLQFLGASSYGIYLLHITLASQVRAFAGRVVSVATLPGAMVLLALEVAVTILGAWWMHRTIERWSMKAAARIRWERDGVGTLRH